MTNLSFTSSGCYAKDKKNSTSLSEKRGFFMDKPQVSIPKIKQSFNYPVIIVINYISMYNI
jgi:hypothetical protein